jgi:hypothetical protein
VSLLSRCKRCIFNSYKAVDRDSKSAEGNLVGVRPPLPAPTLQKSYRRNGLSDGERPFPLVAVLVAVRLSCPKARAFIVLPYAFAKRNGDTESWA